ncbi:MAG: DoxX family protein [Pseudomonadota bacterium]
MPSALYDDLGKLLLRLTVGGLMLFHGISKLGDGGSLRWIGGQLDAVGLPSLLAYGVFIGEIVAPLMVIAGVYTRIGGLLLIANMFFAIGLVHVAELFLLNETGGYALELQAFFVFAAATVALLGSGRFALKPD